jgi:hypothetical protein
MRLVRILSVFIAFSLNYISIVLADSRISDGLELVQSGTKGLTYLKVDLDKFDLRVLTATVPPSPAADSRVISLDRSATGFSLSDYQRLYKAVAVMSGGYIATFSPPAALGLIKSNGILASSAHNSWLVNGVVCANSGQVVIKEWTSGIDLSGYKDCLQSGPLLLRSKAVAVDGEENNAGYQKLARSSQEQTFACVLPDNHVAIGVATTKTDLVTLVGLLLNEVNCIDAIRLTGRETSGLRVGDQTYGNDLYLFPDVIAVIPRIQ